MFSKLRRSQGTACVLLLSLTTVLSCTPKLGEEAPPPKQQEFSGTACLSNATTTVGRFLDGVARDGEIIQAWGCFENAFAAFEKYVRGSSRDSYTPAEMASFFENEFIARRPDGSIHAIPPSLQAEMMKIKQLITGGSATSITRSEIRSLISRVDRFRELTLKVNPYMKVLLQKWEPSFDQTTGLSQRDDVAFFDEANRSLREVAREVGELIQANGQAYRLDDVVVLLQELSSYIGDDWTVTQAVARFMPLAKKLKKSLTGGGEERIEANEWKLVSVTTLRTYMQYLRYQYFVTQMGERVGREQRLTTVSRIVEESVEIVEDLVRLKADGAVSRTEIDELAAVLSKAFPDFKTSSVLLDEMMKIKQLLFGGSVDRIASTDFQTARLKVSRIKALFDLLAPHARIYAGDWTGGARGGTEATKAEFARAQAVLERAAADLASMLIVTDGVSYNLRGILNLARELEKLYPPQKGQGVGASLSKFFPLVMSAKRMLYADKDDLIRPQQWKSFLETGARAYMAGMSYVYFIRDEDARQARTLRNLREFAQDVLNQAQQWIETNPVSYFPRSQVADLLGEANKLGVIPGGFSNKILSQVLQPVLNRVLNPPQKRLAGQRPEAFRQSSVETLRQEFLIWVDTAIFLAETFQGSDKVTLTAGELRNAIDRQLGRKGISEGTRIGLSELKSLLATNQSLVLDGDRRVYISVSGRLKYNYWSAERHNLIRALSRVFIASYANDLNRIRRYQGVTLSEAKTAFRDFFQVAVSLGLIDSSNTGFMDSRFREANLFMPRSDGNSLASFVEVHELIFSIMSGLVLDEKLKGEVRSKCANGTRKNNVRVPYSCLARVYSLSFPRHLTSMPDLLRYQARSNNENFNQFFWDALKGSAGWVPVAPNYLVSFADASLLPQLLQYIEFVFARFDNNNDGLITTAEAVRAFPLFEPLLKDLAKADLQSGRIKEQDMLALFTYILRYGKPPGGVWEGLTRWYPWKDNPAKWDVAADRGQMSGILAFISDQVNSSLMVPQQ